MIYKGRLFGFKLPPQSDYIEIGGGEGDLSLDLKNRGLNIILFIEPDSKKFNVASKRLTNVLCLNLDAVDLDISQIKPKSKIVTVIMQDVIEHISFEKQKLFFQIISSKYEKIYFLGRTPNLKSPFGLRNSFGDNTHMHRFTNTSLNDFLEKLGFKNIKVTKESYKITGIISFLRFFPYFFIVLLVSLSFAFIFGSWEGMLTPNITFKSIRIKYKSI